jgi:hypothetical protein
LQVDSRAADTAASTALRDLKCIDTYKKVDAMILQVVTTRHEIPVKTITPVKLREHVFIWVENQAAAAG